ncbi:Hypothetical Protein FCC1311_033032 [Hondaea fermentalgiana]|uniref:Legume lectin domain-containing protein n=1 Tax=Hondaea fermentalgiana TaxID=2315210 RepID=A0A2R5G7W3_9STRA|nr:Hypothetical Protein FCC1311_033032 [Hondaea fermentalgiana]|eukprot:GBG27080.1 Hypothetical Protein FCC1311_033032 [Hondaea fermentalgiana]
MWCQLMREADSFGFKYADFNQTDGLLFLGDAITSSCEEKDGADAQSQLAYGYQPRHGKTSPASMLHLLTETVETIRDMRVETAREADADDMETNLAGIGHRDESFFGGFADLETDDCALRLRLTSSQPNETGAVWRDEGTNVLQGFSTKFNFQISDLSRACALVRDASFSSKRYESCSVHGGDGFAFVIHGDDGDRTALGQGGADLGFGGLQNALAIEFDVWYNAERGDAFEDHVTVLAAGPGETLLAREALHLSSPQPTALADGRIHSARIVYYPFLNTDLLPFFQITTTGTAYVVDNGEGYRLGTLGIFIDGNNTHPLVAIPINLSAFLDLEENRAIVGFTSATGRSWASHDILSWTFCESHDDADCA